jgi:hypothetical protein
MLAKQVLCSGYVGDGGLPNCLPRLAWKLDPPDLSLPSSKNYKCEPLGLAVVIIFIEV